MTDSKGNSGFCFPDTLNVLQGKAEGNIEVEGKQNSLFPLGSVIKCFVLSSDSKIGNCKKLICLTSAGTTNLSWFQDRWPDHVWVKSSSCCFPEELASFVCPGELVSFDPWHVTRPPIRKRLWVGRYNNTIHRLQIWRRWHQSEAFR